MQRMKLAVVLAGLLVIGACGGQATTQQQPGPHRAAPAAPKPPVTAPEAQAPPALQRQVDMPPGSFVRQSSNPREQQKNVQRAERRLSEINVAIQNLRLALDMNLPQQQSQDRIRTAYERLQQLGKNPDGSTFHGELDQLQKLHDVHRSRYQQVQQELERQLAVAARFKPQRDFLLGILGDGPIPATGVRLPAGPGQEAPVPRDYELDELVGHVRSTTKQLRGLVSAAEIQAWARSHRSLPDFRNHFLTRSRTIRARLDTMWTAEAAKQAFAQFDAELARFDEQVYRIARAPGSDLAMGRRPAANQLADDKTGAKEDAPHESAPAKPPAPQPPVLAGDAQRMADSYFETVRLTHQMAETLRSLETGAAAAEVGSRLRGQAQQYVKHGEAATRFYLSLDSAERNRAFAAAAARLQNLPDKPAPDRGDLLSVMVEAAQSAAGSAIRDDLQFVRDKLLGTRGIHMPVNLRKRIAETLGPAGSPLQIR